MSAGIIRIKRKGLLELCYGFDKKSRLPICPAEQNVNLRQVAELIEHSIIYSLCLRKLPLSEIGQAQCVSDIKIGGRQLHCDLQFACRLHGVTEHEICL